MTLEQRVFPQPADRAHGRPNAGAGTGDYSRDDDHAAKLSEMFPGVVVEDSHSAMVTPSVAAVNLRARSAGGHA